MTTDLTTGERLKQRRRQALRIGCGVLVAIPVVLILLLLAVSTLQLRRVQRKADAIQPGMSATEAALKAEDWFDIWMTKAGDDHPALKARSLGEGGGFGIYDFATNEETVYRSQAEFLAAFTRTVNDGHRWKLRFRYLTVLPRQTHFAVELDQRGRVAGVTEVTPDD